MSRFPEFAPGTLGFGLGLCLTLGAFAVQADPLGLGRAATLEEIVVWDIDVRPDGAGLPPGQGDVETGDAIFAAQCAACHGVFGEGTGRWPVLAGGFGTLTDQRPVKTIGSYWPYLSTVFDYVNRAMPFGAAQTLEPDEVYAITAYLMYLNNEVDDDFVLSSENFAEQSLPNEDGFFMDDRESKELVAFSAAPCMSDCKTEVKITGRAAVLDVTPEETARKAAEAAAKAKAEDEAKVDAPADGEEKVELAATEPAPTQEPPASTPDPALVEAGEKVFRKCKACHQVGETAKNRVGPMLTGIVGAPAGAVEGFKYSSAMQEAGAAGLVWDHEALTGFLTKPRGFMKGTKMSFGGLRKQEDIDALIAYLQSES